MYKTNLCSLTTFKNFVTTGEHLRKVKAQKGKQTNFAQLHFEICYHGTSMSTIIVHQKNNYQNRRTFEKLNIK